MLTSANHSPRVQCVIEFTPKLSNPVASGFPVYNTDGLGYNSSIDMGGDKLMDFEKYIDRLEKDRQLMEQHLREDRHAMEQRLSESQRLSEERMNTRFSETMAKLDKAEERWEARHIASEERMDIRFREVMTKLDNSIDKMDESKRWIIGVCVTTIIGIAAMVITIVIATQ